MRVRHERRLAKRVRACKPRHFLAQQLLQRAIRNPVGIGLMLRQATLDPTTDWQTRGQAARILSAVDSRGIVADLLGLFYSQTEKEDLWQTALTLESLCSRETVRPLVKAFHDANLDRRHAAARALGWIPNAGRTAANALVEVLADRSQPNPVREEAAESLAYLGCASAVPALVRALDDTDVRIRFWAVFALGSLAGNAGSDQTKSDIVRALERMLLDNATPPGNWWPVRREALSMLGTLTPGYEALLADEIAAVLSDPDASAEDKWWAKQC